jgi:NAD(P)-dependent dehydrogenase (short-subunit alcohol dehydrogenase family)
MSLTGRRIVVTGASSGVGRAAAEAFVREGAIVAMLARRRALLEEQAQAWGPRAIPIAADVADPASCEAAVAEADRRLRGFDTVINAAGIAYPTPLADLDESQWNTVIATNLSGSFFVARHAALRMRAAGVEGAIVNVSSELGLVGMSEYSAYCASKAGLIGLTRALAAELAPRIRVNVVCPGPIDTPQLRAEFDWYGDAEKARTDTLQRVPLRRFASADEIVAAIRFLAFDAPFATGTVMSVDGGTTAV